MTNSSQWKIITFNSYIIYKWIIFNSKLLVITRWYMYKVDGMGFVLIFCQIGDVAAKTEALAMIQAGQVLSVRKM